MDEIALRNMTTIPDLNSQERRPFAQVGASFRISARRDRIGLLGPPWFPRLFVPVRVYNVGLTTGAKLLN